MKLYLSSYRVPNPSGLEKLLTNSPSHTKVAIVANAKDYLIDRARNVKVRDIKKYLSELDFANIEEVDLRAYKDPAQLQKDLGHFHMIWVAGGNTFCLMEQMRSSGFDKINRNLLEDGVVYCGESAGAVAAGKSLRGVELDDEPEFAEKQYWDGLNLIDKFILPHADNRFYAASNEQALKLYGSDQIVALNDNQALIVVDGKQQILVGKE